MATTEKSLDKIHEIYMGDNSSVFTQKTRERIHWICEQAIGESILDIGCSQGTIPLLLGKSGKQVLGIDIEEDAIIYANNLLTKESQEVQNMVSFCCSDILLFSSDCMYDTIILTEVLEHILDVDAILKKIISLINANGRIIITVPFGINDFWDHKRTYYFIRLYKELKNYFLLSDVKFFDDWIGAVCNLKETTKEKAESTFVEIELIEAEENAFYKRERTLINNRDRYKKAYQEQREVTYCAKEEIGILKEKLAQCKNDNVRWKGNFESAQEQIKVLKEKTELNKKEVNRWKMRSQTLQEQIENMKEKIEQNKSDIIRWKERSELLQTQVENLKGKLEQNKNDIARWKEKSESYQKQVTLLMKEKNENLNQNQNQNSNQNQE